MQLTRINEKSCFHIARLSGNDTVIAVRQRRPQCYKFAQSLGGAFTAMEEMDCSALTRASQKNRVKTWLTKSVSNDYIRFRMPYRTDANHIFDSEE